MDTALHCPTCGYNLTGLPENRCPECGHGFDKERIAGWQLDRVRQRRAWKVLLQPFGLAAAIALLATILPAPVVMLSVLLTAPLNSVHTARGLVRAWHWPEERPLESYEYVDVVLGSFAILIVQVLLLGLGLILVWVL